MSNTQPPSSGPDPQNPYGQQPNQPYGQQPPQPYGQPSAGDPNQAYGQQPGQPYGQHPDQPYGQPTQPYGQPTPPPAQAQAGWSQGSADAYGAAGYSPIPSGGAPSGPGYPGGPGASAGPGGPVPPGYPVYGQAPQPGGPGQPPKKSGVPKVAIIIGASAVALILIIVGAFALFNRSPEPVVGGGGGTTVPAPQATKASDAVKGYLDALAAGQAEAALAFGNDQPADKTFLTDAVLAESVKRAPITDIVVPEVADENAYQVSATYKIGGQAVNQSFSVRKEGDAFQLSDTTQDVSLGSVQSNTVPMLINGVKVTTEKVTLLPGSYAVTSGLTNINYGPKSTILIKSPQDYAPIELTPTLTKAGSAAFVKAAKSAMAKCVDEHALAPKGCPFGLRASSGQKVTASTIRWKLTGNPWDNLKPRLDYQNPARAEASASMTFTFTAKGTQDGRPGTFPIQKVYEYVQMQGDVSKDAVKVTFE